ncbi:MAG: Cysteine desulfuration protein SufE [Prosthecobacter sp.]|nr:Cysteine desulfuration protein SufE [Prosthecobacter sp.]
MMIQPMHRMSLAARQNELIEGLSLIENVHERLAALTSYVAKTRLPAELKDDALIVPGCVSRVWVLGELQDGLTRFRCEADSPMVAGLVAVLCDLYSGALPAEAAAVEPELWIRCGFTRILSPTRLNGLAAVRARIRTLAQQWS